ncbi:hypothetical protein KI387_011584, partial [Taxus chinensis]
MEESTTVDELIGPFEEHFKKEARNTLSFNKDALESLSGICATIALIEEKHSSWFEKCKDINSILDGWTKTLSYVRIPHTDRVASAVAHFSKEFKGVEIFSAARDGDQSDSEIKSTGA